MQLYEFVFIVQPNFVQQEMDGLIQEFHSLLSKSGSKVEKYENWGMRDLAYPIKKFRKGCYLMMCIRIHTKNLEEFKRKVKLNENVMRSFYVSISSVNKEASPIMNAD